MRGWQVALSQERKLSTATIRRKLYAIQSFCQFLVRTGAIGYSQNPMIGVVKPKKRKRVRQGLRQEDWDRVMALELPSGEHEVRALFAYAGLRREELIFLTVGQLHLASPEQAAIHVVGKGRKERWVPCPTNLRTILWDYLLRTGKTGPREYLFPRPDGRPLRFTRVNYLVNRWGKRVGIQLFPHLFRHYYVTSLAMRGVPLPTLQEWVGHEDLATTQSYLHAAQDRSARGVLEKFAGGPRISPQDRAALESFRGSVASPHPAQS